MKTKIDSLLKSFVFSFNGIKFGIKNERNMRIHICATVLVTYFAILFKLSSIEYAILFLTMGFVMSAEMLNTSIETIVDIGVESYDNLARIAKDIAAGSVLISAMSSVVVAIFLFFKPKKFIATITLIFTSPHLLLILILLVTGSFIFIFGTNKKQKIRMKNFKE